MLVRLTFTVTFLSLLVACAPAVTGFDDCPVTQSGEQSDFIGALYGDEDGLRVYLNNNGVWRQLPIGEKGGYNQKIFWKFPGYVAMNDPMPDLAVMGRQLNGNGSFVSEGPATNATSSETNGDAILSGVEIPTYGCWELTGEYEGSKLSFVVWVGE
jgi:hypothetical protein